MDFEDFCNDYTDQKQDKQFSTPKDQTKNSAQGQSQTLGANGISEDDIKKKIEKYKNYSNQQLLTELLAEANKQKMSGNLTEQKLQQMIEGISPYLDDAQKQKLNEIAKLLR